MKKPKAKLITILLTSKQEILMIKKLLRKESLLLKDIWTMPETLITMSLQEKRKLKNNEKK